MKRKKNKEHEESQERKIQIFSLKFARKYKLKKRLFEPLYNEVLFTVFMRCRIFETQ